MCVTISVRLGNHVERTVVGVVLRFSVGVR